VVAHGSGTPPHGLEACRLGIQAVIKEFYENEPFRDVPIQLEAAIQVANQVVHDYTWLNFEEPILGNSMVVAVVKGNEVTIASIGGDAAGYLIRETNVQELVPLERSSLPADFLWFPLLGDNRTPLAVRTKSTDPFPPNKLYFDLVSRVPLKRGDVLILTSDVTSIARPSWLGEPKILQLVKDLADRSAIPRHLARIASESWHHYIKVTVTAVWIP
jgi:hypothetical protein